MNNRDRFLVGEVFSFLQKPHYYRFCSTNWVLQRNINNSLVGFEDYAWVQRLNKTDFDCIVINCENNILGHHWEYNDFHFGWMDEWKWVKINSDMYVFGKNVPERALDGFGKMSLQIAGYVEKELGIKDNWLGYIKTSEFYTLLEGGPVATLEEYQQEIEKILKKSGD